MAVIDPSIEWSPAWWAAQLGKRLDARVNGDRAWNRQVRRRGRGKARPKPGIQLLDDYVHGDPPIPRMTDAWRDGMRGFLRMSRMNYADLCVSSVSSKMGLIGVRTASDSDESADQVAERIAVANDMRSWLPELWDDMIGTGFGFASVGAGLDAETGMPSVVLESPFQCYQASDSTGRRPLAQLKRAVDEWTGNTVTFVWSKGDPANPSPLTVHVILDTKAGRQWGEGGADGTVVQGFPLEEFRNRDAAGDFETHLDVLDRVNDGIFERVVIAKYQAFRQRVALGTPDTDDQGKPIDYSEILTTDPGAWMRLPGDATMWESGTVDLGPIRDAIKDDVMAFAAVTRSPLNYLMPDAANGSAEGAKSLRESYQDRVADRIRRADRPLARVMAKAFRAMDDEARADVLSIVPLWEALDGPSVVDQAQAFAQARAGGWPFADAARRFIGVPPSEIPALQDARSDDLLFDAAQAEALAPPAAPPASGGQDVAVA